MLSLCADSPETSGCVATTLKLNPVPSAKKGGNGTGRPLKGVSASHHRHTHTPASEAVDVAEW